LISGDKAMSKETPPKLNKFSFKKSEIELEAFTWTIPKTRKSGGLLVFSGFYGRGSAGHADARFIDTSIAHFYSLGPVDCLIIDLRKLDYVWGDDLSVHPPHRIISNNGVFRIVIPTEEENPEVHQGMRGVLSSKYVVTDILQAFKDCREGLKDKVDFYAAALEVYDDDYMDEAQDLFHIAMLHQGEPTAEHFALLAEAERIAKIQFLGKLKDKYPDSKLINLQFAERYGLQHAIKAQTEQLSQDDLDEVTERSLRQQRFVTNCKVGRHVEQQYLYEDFLYLWTTKQDEKAASFRLVMLKNLISGHGMQEPEVIPVLERLLQSQDLDAKTKYVIEAKIELLKRLEEFRASE
jgi:hypothetical protein